ncbi:MAG: lipoate protein ligase C-terminal domain-containing protein [Desulfurococcus sp.]|jgi:hypothetical protein|uniref:lipoate protein ligase C-terminal domain-containing protein n=1 Tax=Desulfurococcus sp. TaxID=51678 RepID=UPI003164F2F1
MRLTRVLRGEKTVSIDIEVEECVIRRIMFSGDFFAYPEENIEKLEESLKNCRNIECINNAFKTVENTLFIGVNWETLKNEVVNMWRTLCK